MGSIRVKLLVWELNKLFSKLKPEDVQGLDPAVRECLDRVRALKDNPKGASESDLKDLVMRIDILKKGGLL